MKQRNNKLSSERYTEKADIPRIERAEYPLFVVAYCKGKAA